MSDVAYDLVWGNNGTIHDEWRDLFTQTGLDIKLREALRMIEQRGDMSRICPNATDIGAFARQPLSAVRVVIIGMDPYPRRENACGIAFGVPNGVAPPHSLDNMYKALIAQGLMNAEHKHCGNLSRWIDQGVLLLNYALTTIVGKSGAHTAIWDSFARTLIAAICRARPGTIFMLFGTEARKLDEIIRVNRCQSLQWSHPSPLVRANNDPLDPRNFIRCNTFTLANNMLNPPICWDPMGDADADASTSDASTSVAASASASPRATTSILCAEHTISCDLLDPLDELNPPQIDGIIYAFVDGACRSKRISASKREPIAGYGIVIVVRDEIVRIKGLVRAVEGSQPTNNRGELCALMEMFKYVSSREFIERWPQERLVIVYDSQYAAGCVCEWYDKWLREHPKEIKLNCDIISVAYQKMKCVQSSREIEWVHVNSHIPEPTDARDSDFARKWFYWRGNKEADAIASEIVAQHL